MQTQLPRVFDRPSGLPLYAWVTSDNAVCGLQSFEDPSFCPDDAPKTEGSRWGIRPLIAQHGPIRCLPLFGAEATADLARQFFSDTYEVRDGHVIRTRTVVDR